LPDLPYLNAILPNISVSKKACSVVASIQLSLNIWIWANPEPDSVDILRKILYYRRLSWITFYQKGNDL
jgi:hypothetical protein